MGECDSIVAVTEKSNPLPLPFPCRQKSSFSKFDALQKKAAAAAAQPHASGTSSANVLGLDQNSVRCTACEKVVYQMEQMKV